MLPHSNPTVPATFLSLALPFLSLFFVFLSLSNFSFAPGTLQLQGQGCSHLAYLWVAESFLGEQERCREASPFWEATGNVLLCSTQRQYIPGVCTRWGNWLLTQVLISVLGYVEFIADIGGYSGFEVRFHLSFGLLVAFIALWTEFILYLVMMNWETEVGLTLFWRTMLLCFASAQGVKVIFRRWGKHNSNGTDAVAAVTPGRARLSLVGMVCFFQLQRLEPL